MAKKQTPRPSVIPVERIARAIYLIRGEKVMLDYDLAELYGVQTKALSQAVTRNIELFLDDFLHRFTPEETQTIKRSQIVTGSQNNRDLCFALRAFTPKGVAILSSEFLLNLPFNSPRKSLTT